MVLGFELQSLREAALFQHHATIKQLSSGQHGRGMLFKQADGYVISRYAGTANTSTSLYYNNRLHCTKVSDTGDYLQNLRSNPVSRPPGARPLGHSASRRSLVNDSIASGEHSTLGSDRILGSSSSSSALSKQYRDVSEASGRTSTERMYWPSKANWNQRQQEMDEARMMRDVLARDDMEEHARIQADARREAEMLMWQHQNPHAPYRVSDREHYSSRSRHASRETPRKDFERDDVPAARLSQRQSPRKFSNPFSLSRLSLNGRSGRRRDTNSGPHDAFPSEGERIYEDDATSANSEDSMVPAPLTFSARRPLRNSSASYMNAVPNDASPTPNSKRFEDVDGKHYYDDYDQHRTRDAELAQVYPPDDPYGDWEDETRYRDGIEIRSEEIRAATSMKRRDRSPNLPSPTAVSDRPGRPIVSFDQDWQPREDDHDHTLSTAYANQRPSPMPLRPFVNRFEEPKFFSEPVIPTLNFHGIPDIQVEEVQQPAVRTICEPTIQVSEPDTYFDRPKVPTIQIDNDEEHTHHPSTRDHTYHNHQPQPPSISIQGPSPHKQHPHHRGAASRPPPRHAATTPIWRPRHQPTAPSILCAQCALPISGRTVTAASARFHPACFTCHACAQSLEHVGFHPEPGHYREARLDRIQRRQDGEEEVPPPEGVTLEDDEDDSLRFYCQLDFHECFSPRCRTCRTPIEGEVIEACGGTYHASPNHFFCCQCGDPFANAAPYIEAQSYAWCIPCHTQRFSTKCQGCRKPITEASVEALDGEFHEECFRCAECSGELAGGRFLEREGKPVCLECGGCMRVKGFRELWGEGVGV
ncbi:MAG: hypothetical protein M1828_004508 [Chrysothrix sp. TS-e1954]|nr:MAG: hypothetical protein M1828_004508 [Chrysothrix sp. TS-e1954]